MIISPLPSRLLAAPPRVPALLCKTVPAISPASAGRAGPPRGRRGLRGTPRPGTPSAPPSLEACPETQFFHCPPVSSPFGKPRGGREGAAGRAPASGRAAAAAPVSCRRNARRYAPVSRSGSPSLLEHSSAYITQWQQSTFPAVS